MREGVREGETDRKREREARAREREDTAGSEISGGCHECVGAGPSRALPRALSGFLAFRAEVRCKDDDGSV